MKTLKLISSLLLIVAIVASCATSIKFFRIKPNEIISAAEVQASSIIDVANSEAEAILADADEQASSIIDAAEKEKEKRIAEAKAKAEAEAKKKKLSSSPINISFPLKLSAEDKQLLYQICHAEDRGSVKGTQAVCWVILNRLASPRFPNTMRGVLYQKHKNADGKWVWQFTPAQSGSINNTPAEWVKDAVDEVLAGNVPDPTYGSLYFATPEAAVGHWWEVDLNYVCSVGEHKYFKP